MCISLPSCRSQNRSGPWSLVKAIQKDGKLQVRLIELWKLAFTQTWNCLAQVEYSNEETILSMCISLLSCRSQNRSGPWSLEKAIQKDGKLQVRLIELWKLAFTQTWNCLSQVEYSNEETILSMCISLLSCRSQNNSSSWCLAKVIEFRGKLQVHQTELWKLTFSQT